MVVSEPSEAMSENDAARPRGLAVDQTSLHEWIVNRLEGKEGVAMKRYMIVAVAVALLAMVGTYGVLAQQDTQTPTPPGGMGRGPGMMRGGAGMMPQGMMAHQGCAMCGMMTGAMMWKSMTATSDGGVIVAVGNRLIKYDNQLNVVKDTELKIDMNQMFASMQKIMENCPMCKQMMQAQGQTQTSSQAQARE